MESVQDRMQGLPLSYPGIYFGLVEDVADPERYGRVRVRVYHVHSPDPGLVPTESLPWAPLIRMFGGTATPGATSEGAYFVPAHGSQVAVVFNHGDPLYPICLGSIFGAPGGVSEVPIEVLGRVAGTPSNNTLGTNAFPGSNLSNGAETATLVKEIRTERGHKILLDDNSTTPDVIFESAAGHIVTLDDDPTRQRMEFQTKGGHNITLWDGTSSTPARMEITSKGGHKISIDDNSGNQIIKIKTTLGHEFLMTDAGPGQYCSLRTVGASGLKIDDNGSGGSPQITLDTRAGVKLLMFDTSDSLYATTAGNSGMVAVGNGYVTIATETGYRVELGGVQNKLTINCPASGSLDVLSAGTLTMHSDMDMFITSNANITIKGQNVFICP